MRAAPKSWSKCTTRETERDRQRETETETETERERENVSFVACIVLQMFLTSNQEAFDQNNLKIISFILNRTGLNAHYDNQLKKVNQY